MPYDQTHYAPLGVKAIDAGELYYPFTETITTDVLTAAGLLTEVSPGTGIWELKDGLYYTTMDIDLGFGNVTGENITFVAGGTINISGSDQVLKPFKPFVDNLLAFSFAFPDNQCSDMVVKFNGSGFTDWQGTIFAPYAGIDMSGSDNTSFSGSIIGYVIKLGGSSLTVHAPPDPNPPVVSLIE